MVLMSDVYVWESGQRAIAGPDWNKLVSSTINVETLVIKEVSELPPPQSSYENQLVKVSGHVYIFIP